MSTLFPISLLVQQGEGLMLEFKEHFTCISPRKELVNES
jgi:hypothetical protein